MKNTYSDTELASLNNLVAAVFRFEQADSRVGRNKAFRAQARISVSGNLPETTTTRYAWVALFRPTQLLTYQ
jgi:hypothetical protein